MKKVLYEKKVKNNFEKIKESVRYEEYIHPMLLNATPDELLNCSIDEMVEIINSRSEKDPCNYYCHNCGEKGVPFSVCRENIKKWLLERTYSSSLYEVRNDVEGFVIKLFDGVVDKGGEPYIKHLKAVEAGVGNDLYARIAALLHDVFEDTDTKESEIEELGVPDFIISSVKILTRSETETYSEYMERVLTSNDITALLVKKSDLEHNMDITRIPNPVKKDFDRVEKRYKPNYEKVCTKILELNKL